MTDPAAAPPPEPTSAPQAPGPGDRFTRHWILVWGTVLLFLLAALGAAYLFFPQSASDDEGRYVALYVTDLPGGFERLELSLAAATVGEAHHALQVDEPFFEISLLQGPDAALLVASGRVPWDADGSASLVFDAARGWKDGAWRDVDVPKSRITLPNALPKGDFASSAALFDFDLEAGLVVVGDEAAFHPFVRHVYQYGDSTTNHFENSTRDWSRAVHVELPEQYLDALADRVVDGLCQRLTASCAPPAATGPVGTIPATGRSTSSPAPWIPPSPGVVNRAPIVPHDPSPADGQVRVGAAQRLSWQGGDPEGGPVEYQLFLQGAEVEGCRGTVTYCDVTGLSRGTSYRWHVVARDAGGLEAQGPEWSFVTNHPPSVVVGPVAEGGPNPATGSQERPFTVLTLYFNGTDPDDASLHYRVVLKANTHPSLSGTADERCAWQATASCTLTNLAANTWYYWRVEVKDGDLVSAGPVWNFKTKEDSPGPIPTATGACPPVCGGTP